jgi:hypothetical protein
MAAVVAVTTVTVAGCTSSTTAPKPTGSSATDSISASSTPSARAIANLTPVAMKTWVAAAIPNARLDATKAAGGLNQMEYSSDAAPIAAAELTFYVDSGDRVTFVRCADVQTKAATSKAIAACVSLPVPGLDQKAAQAWYRKVSDMATQPDGVPGLTSAGLHWTATCAGGRCSIDVAPAG